MVEPGAGSIVSQDNTEKPHFEAIGGNRRILRRKHAFSRSSLSNQFYRPRGTVGREHRELMNIGNAGQDAVDHKIQVTEGGGGRQFWEGEWLRGAVGLGGCPHTKIKWSHF